VDKDGNAPDSGQRPELAPGGSPGRGRAGGKDAPCSPRSHTLRSAPRGALLDWGIPPSYVHSRTSSYSVRRKLTATIAPGPTRQGPGPLRWGIPFFTVSVENRNPPYLSGGATRRGGEGE
jgi:hypothetical protein